MYRFIMYNVDICMLKMFTYNLLNYLKIIIPECFFPTTIKTHMKHFIIGRL